MGGGGVGGSFRSYWGGGGGVHILVLGVIINCVNFLKSRCERDKVSYGWTRTILYRLYVAEIEEVAENEEEAEIEMLGEEQDY